MRYITFGDFDTKDAYLIKDLGKSFAILEITDGEISDVKDKVEHIEPDFTIDIQDLNWRDLGELGAENILVVTIGQDYEAPEMQYTYDMSNRKWKLCQKKHDRGIWIHCFSKTGKVLASELLLALNKVKLLSEKLGKLLIIVGDFESVLPHFKFNSLTEKVIETYLAGSLEKFLKTKHHSARYTQQKIKETLKPESLMREYEFANIPLYTRDPFYQLIPPDQKIYLPLDLLENKFDNNYYGKLGLHLIELGKRNAFFYDKKSIIDANRQILVGNVLPNFVNPILTKAPIDTIQSMPVEVSHNIDASANFTGRDVLIGIITETGIDYTNPCICRLSGETRILDYWVQEESIKGTSYSEEQINDAIITESLNDAVPLELGEDYTTMLLGMAGGGQEGIEFMAKDSQFLVAKINTAPKSLQAIYGGDTKEPAVMMPDILIAADHMLNVAHKYNMPLVMLIPYNTNLSSHDGSGVYEQLLGRIGSQQGCTIVVPTGDEGNKAHHVTIVQDKQVKPYITFKVSKPTDNLVGTIQLTNFGEASFEFYPNNQKKLEIYLEEKGTYRINNTIITTTGIVTNFQNGAYYLNFRIQNMSQGKWNLDCLFDSVTSSTKVDLWIGQQALNSTVIVDPSTPNITLGSNAAINSIISVGAFDHHNLVVLALSGRGYNWANEILPICTVIGRITAIDENDEAQYDIEGTVISAALLVGALALLHERWVKERGEPFANSLVMQKRLINYLKQFSGLTYPNTSQGYGVFELQNLAKLTDGTKASPTF